MKKAIALLIAGALLSGFAAYTVGTRPGTIQSR